MIIVDFNSETWTDPWFRKLPLDQKVLFIYLWTNSHKNNAGLYVLDTDTMAFETGIPTVKIEDCLSSLQPKVKYDRKRNIVWVVNHTRHQYMRTPNISPKIVAGIEKNLLAIGQHRFVDEFLNHYPRIAESVSIPYQDTLSGYPSSEGEGAGKGEGERKGGMGSDSSDFNECMSPDSTEIWKDEDKF